MFIAGCCTPFRISYSCLQQALNICSSLIHLNTFKMHMHIRSVGRSVGRSDGRTNDRTNERMDGRVDRYFEKDYILSQRSLLSERVQSHFSTRPASFFQSLRSRLFSPFFDWQQTKWTTLAWYWLDPPESFFLFFANKQAESNQPHTDFIQPCTTIWYYIIRSRREIFLLI